MEFYTPETQVGAMQRARYVFCVLLEAAKVTQISSKEGVDGKPDVDVVLDRRLIPTVGKAAIGDFLPIASVQKSSRC